MERKHQKKACRRRKEAWNKIRNEACFHSCLGSCFLRLHMLSFAKGKHTLFWETRTATEFSKGEVKEKAHRKKACAPKESMIPFIFSFMFPSTKNHITKHQTKHVFLHTCFHAFFRMLSFETARTKTKHAKESIKQSMQQSIKVTGVILTGARGGGGTGWPAGPCLEVKIFRFRNPDGEFCLWAFPVTAILHLGPQRAFPVIAILHLRP